MDTGGAAAANDVLTTGPSDRNRRVWRWSTIVVAAVLLAAFGFHRVDQSARHSEISALAMTSADAQATAAHADAQVRSTRAYTLPQLQSAPAAVRVGLAKLIADSAGRGVADLRASRSAVASTSVLPWHGSIRAAKRAELAYLDTWISYLDKVAAGGDIGERPSQTLDADQATARAALAAAA